jgi:hypothetical protein
MSYTKPPVTGPQRKEEEIIKEALKSGSRLLAVFSATPEGVYTYISHDLTYEGLALFAEVMEATLIDIKKDLKKRRQ